MHQEGKRAGRTYKEEKSRELRRTFLGRLVEGVKEFRQRKREEAELGHIPVKAVRNDVTSREKGKGNEPRERGETKPTWRLL